MNIYDLFMKVFEDGGLRSTRKRLLIKAKGVVLELGVGTGANLPFYKMNQIEKLILTDVEKRPIVNEKMSANPNLVLDESKVVYAQADAQLIPMENDSVDTVVATLIFCSVPDVAFGLNEIKRVLKPGGQLIFIEHVISPRRSLAVLMTFFTPLWKRLANGCHLNRDYNQSLQSCGYSIVESHNLFGSIFISGIAKPIQIARECDLITE